MGFGAVSVAPSREDAFYHLFGESVESDESDVGLGGWAGREGGAATLDLGPDLAGDVAIIEDLFL